MIGKRRGAAKGSGSGYKNLPNYPKDPKVHSMSAKGMKQPQITSNQRERQSYRSRSGRYAKYNPCEICGKSAGLDYYSLEGCNQTGLGVVICKSCAKKYGTLTAEQAKRLGLFDKSNNDNNPFSQYAGYKESRKLPDGTYVVIYDNKNQQTGIDSGDNRWVVVIEGGKDKGRFVVTKTLGRARQAAQDLDFV